MLATAAATFILASTLSVASPLPPRRSASVVTLPARNAPNKVFNAAHVKQDLSRVRAKYNPDVVNKRIAVALARTDEQPAKRSLPSSKLYDVKLHRRQDDGNTGSEPLVDVFDTIDECECVI